MVFTLYYYFSYPDYIAKCPYKHTSDVNVNGVFLPSCKMTSIKSRILHCQVVYDQIPALGIDPHPLVSCISIIHVNATGHQPCQYLFCVRNKAAIPYFSRSIGIAVGRINGTSQGIIMVQDYWNWFCWNCWKCFALIPLHNACVVIRAHFSRFLDFFGFNVHICDTLKGLVAMVQLLSYFLFVYFTVIFKSWVPVSHAIIGSFLTFNLRMRFVKGNKRPFHYKDVVLPAYAFLFSDGLIFIMKMQRAVSTLFIWHDFFGYWTLGRWWLFFMLWKTKMKLTVGEHYKNLERRMIRHSSNTGTLPIWSSVSW